MLVYSEDFLLEHLAGAISSVDTGWQKEKNGEKQKKKHVNNAENKVKHNIRAKISKIKNDCDIKRKSKQK